MTDHEFFTEVLKITREGTPAALATVVEATGSTPRKAGAKMLVRGDRSIAGTVGGGGLEAKTIEAALESIACGHPRTISFTLTEEHGYVCGGRASIFIEPLNSAPRLVVFGAGHVGRAIVPLAARCGFNVTVIDDRPDYAVAEQFPGASAVVCAQPPEDLSAMRVDERSFIVVVTKGHESDFTAVRCSLGTATPFIGLVGSRRKREALFEILRGEGVAEHDLERIVTPVGLNIEAETPDEIAVSIVAQLIERKRCQARWSA